MTDPDGVSDRILGVQFSHLRQLPGLVGLSIAVLLAACSGKPHLSSAVCNGLIDDWNKNSSLYAAYSEKTTAFRNQVAESKPTKDANQIMIAKVSPDIIDAILAQPSINATAFEAVPSVELHMNDLWTDIAIFIRKVGDTKLESPDGSWGTAPVPGAEGLVNRLIAFETKPGVSGTATFDAMFGASLNRMSTDYSAAFTSMRQEYQVQCKGDPSEVRPLSDF